MNVNVEVEALLSCLSEQKKYEHAFERHTRKGMYDWGREKLSECEQGRVYDDADYLMERHPDDYPTLDYALAITYAEKLALAGKTGFHGVFLEGIDSAVLCIVSYLLDKNNTAEIEKKFSQLSARHDIELEIPCEELNAVSVAYDGRILNANKILVAFAATNDKDGVRVKSFYPVAEL
jgi:hypothetical protein